ncbi:hypothetical protein ABK040_003899 [Willaertia magna]
MGQLSCCSLDNNYQNETIPILRKNRMINSPKQTFFEKDEIDKLIGNELMECDVNKTLQLKIINDYKNNFLKLNNIYLSEEIVLLIFSYLSMKDILNLSILNRSFKRYWTRHPLIWNNFSLKFGFYCKDISTVQNVIDYVFKPNYLLKQSFTKITKVSTKHTFKIVICGDTFIGKSTLINSVLNNVYNKNNEKTVGLQYFPLFLQHNNNSETKMRLDLWDFSGDLKFYPIFPLAARDSRGMMVCFDLSNEMSFDRMEIIFYDYVKTYLSKRVNSTLNEKIKKDRKVICIIGLKFDCITKRNKSLDKKVNTLLKKILGEGDVMFKDLFVQYFEVSSKDNLNVEIPFYFMAYKLLCIMKQEEEVVYDDIVY